MLLNVIGISKQYSLSQTGVLPISFTLQRSECIAVVGESGSGKTTLLQMLAGILPTDTGEMHLHKKRLPSANDMLVRGYPDIQLVPQDFKLLPNHRVWENITYPIRHYAKKQLESRLAYLAELLDLQSLLGRYPRELSGGQQQRTAIARALANEPAILLLDEPFNQADALTTHRLEQALASLKRKSKTAIIFITHSASEALGIADKILVLQAGKLLQYDTPENVYQKPVNAYTGMLLGYLNEFADGITAVRAENCAFSTKKEGLKGHILSVFYEGYRYKYVVMVEGNKQWVVYDTTLLLIGTTQRITWQASKLLYIGLMPDSEKEASKQDFV